VSYYYLRPRHDQDPDPEDIKLHVGRSRLVGTVEVSRVRLDLYVAECSCCGWRKVYRTSSPNVVAWETYCHNWTREKQGCPTNPTREEGLS
jgi:hypothetical protein